MLAGSYTPAAIAASRRGGVCTRGCAEREAPGAGVVRGPRGRPTAAASTQRRAAQQRAAQQSAERHSSAHPAAGRRGGRGRRPRTRALSGCQKATSSSGCTHGGGYWARWIGGQAGRLLSRLLRQAFPLGGARFFRVLSARCCPAATGHRQARANAGRATCRGRRQANARAPSHPSVPTAPDEPRLQGDGAQQRHEAHFAQRVDVGDVVLAAGRQAAHNGGGGARAQRPRLHPISEQGPSSSAPAICACSKANENRDGSTHSSAQHTHISTQQWPHL